MDYETLTLETLIIMSESNIAHVRQQALSVLETRGINAAAVNKRWIAAALEKTKNKE